MSCFPGQQEIPIEIIDRNEILSEPELRDLGQSLLIATLDAASADTRSDHWVRRSALYFGKPLNGWYDLKSWRIAPSPEQPELGYEPLYGASPPQLLLLDVQVPAIDETDATERSLREFTRRLAHASFFLGRPLRWLSDSPVITLDSSGNPLAVKPWRGFFTCVPKAIEPFSDPSLRGEWGQGRGPLWPFLDALETNVHHTLRLPQAALSLQRRLQRNSDRGGNVMAAFDSATRLYHLSQLLPEGFSSASLALKLASVEALARDCLSSAT